MDLFAEIPAAWQLELQSRLNAQSLHALAEFLSAELAQGKPVYPPRDAWFQALAAVAPQQVKVVILGQDPYHGAGEAHGLSFSVPIGVKTPPSLRNIWNEIARDFGITPPQHGNLTGWCEQGVLLLNTSLTVAANQAGSHAKKGWEVLSDAVIQTISDTQTGVVFMLWGAHAQKKRALIDEHQHRVLTAVHPSPLSAYRGFIGCGHFSAANAYLLQQGKTVIDWGQV